MEALVRHRVGKFSCGTTALLLILTLAVTVVTLPLRPAWAQEEVELYHEDFEDGRAQGWRLEEEGDGEVGWSVRDGELHGSEHFWAVYEPGYWYDARLTLLVRLGNPYLDDRGNGGLHIMIRLSEEGRYVLAISPERVTIFKQLGFGEGERFERLAERPVQLSRNRVYEVELLAFEGQLTAVLEGEPIMEARDPDPLPAGTIALETLEDGYARVDEVWVHGPEEAPPPSEEPHLEAVEPREVVRGGRGELDLWGGGFAPGARVHITGARVLVVWAEHVDTGHLRVSVLVEEDATLGERGVVVTNLDGQSALLPRGLEVVEGERPAPAPELVLSEVWPGEVEAGSEAELELFGSGFGGDAEVQVYGGGVEVQGVREIESTRMVASVSVHEDAQPGARTVAVRSGGQQARLDGGLVVSGAAPGPGEPTPPTVAPTAPPGGTGGGDDLDVYRALLWGGATVLLSAASFAAGRGLSLRSKVFVTDQARLQWRVEAKKELPEAKRACQWACQGRAVGKLGDRWSVKWIDLVPLPTRGAALPKKRVESKDLGGLSKLANLRAIVYSDAEIRSELKAAVDALVAQVRSWEQEGQTPASFEVRAKMEGPVDLSFGLHHCKEVSGKLSWGDPLLSWKGKLNQPAGRNVGVLRGPVAGEVDSAARMRRELEDCLVDLAKELRFWL